jgi:hypothetical protein
MPVPSRRPCAAGDEAFGIDDVGGLGDELAGEFDAFGQRGFDGPCGLGALGRARTDDGQAALLLFGRLVR